MDKILVEMMLRIANAEGMDNVGYCQRCNTTTLVEGSEALQRCILMYDKCPWCMVLLGEVKNG